MLDPKTIGYIRSAKSAGISDVDIKNTLATKQIDPIELDNFLQGNSNPPKPAGNNSMWDTFEHFLMFLSMLIFIVSIGLLWHYCIDKWIPAGDTKDSYRIMMGSFSSMMVNGYLAGIIVSLPFFTFLFLRITKNTTLHPELRSLTSRKTLIYLTLAATFIIMTGNIIGFVFNFLNGNVGVNFIAHLLLTLFVNGVIFAYYFYQVREDRKFYA